MKREEFYKLVGHPSEQEGVKEWKETSKYQEVVFVRFIYNQMLNMHRNLPYGYKIQMASIWSQAVNSQLEAVDNNAKEIIEEAFEKSTLAKELRKRGYKIEAKIEVVPQILHTGDIHGWKVYVVFSMNVEGVFLYYGSRFKQKVFVFVEDGVFEKKFPPYRIQDDASPTGWIGVTVIGDTVVEVK